MKNFIFKSTNADLQKMFQLLNTIQSNVLYLTWNVDVIRKDLRKVITNEGLQKQVDEYFEEDEKHIPEVEKEVDHGNNNSSQRTD